MWEEIGNKVPDSPFIPGHEIEGETEKKLLQKKISFIKMSEMQRVFLFFF